MEKMQQFDKLLQEAKEYSWQRMTCRVMAGIAMLSGSVAFKQFEDWEGVIKQAFFLEIAVWYYMAAYMQVGYEKRKTAVYDLLRFTPISKKEIRKNRSKIMRRFVGKLIFIMFLMQIIMSKIMQTDIGIECILYPATVGLWLMINGWLQIVLGTMK